MLLSWLPGFANVDVQSVHSTLQLKEPIVTTEVTRILEPASETASCTAQAMVR